MSTSLIASSCVCANRRRTICFQSGMFHLRHTVYRIDEGFPETALGGEHFSAFGHQFVVATPALSGFFNPAALNPAAVFKPIKERVERGDFESQYSTGAGFNQLIDLIAVSFARFQQRQNQ